MTRAPASDAEFESPHLAAACWALRHEEGPLKGDELRRFERWIGADPKNACLWEDVNWALDAPARHAASDELMEMRAAALAARPIRRSRTAVYSLVAAGVAASIAGLAFLLPTMMERNGARPETAVERGATVYKTAIGERSSFILPDKSIVTLDTDSELRVAFDGQTRGLHLVRGQALFDVAKAARPFVVTANGRTITAVGTLFNVRINGPTVRVALLRGVVRVGSLASSAGAPKPGGIPETVMRAGEVMDAGETRQSVAVAPNIEQVSSWKGGQLVFNDTPLAAAIAEINRYTNQPIALADSAIGEYRISGVFRSDDPRQFAASMAEILPVSVSYRDDGTPVLRARTP